MSWQSEHGKSFDVPANILAAAGLVDQSWHNDICPCFCWPWDDQQDLRLWVDHPDNDQREMPGGKRFMVGRGYDGGHPNKFEQFDTDDLNEALAKMKEWAPPVPKPLTKVLPCAREVLAKLDGGELCAITYANRAQAAAAAAKAGPGWRVWQSSESRVFYAAWKEGQDPAFDPGI